MTRRIAWALWKFGVLKISMIAFGTLMGSYFHEFWPPWHVAMWAAFAITALMATIWGYQEMFTVNSDRKQAA